MDHMEPLGGYDHWSQLVKGSNPLPPGDPIWALKVRLWLPYGWLMVGLWFAYAPLMPPLCPPYGPLPPPCRLRKCRPANGRFSLNFQ